MKNKIFIYLCLSVLIILLLLPAQVLAADDIEVIVTKDGNMECRMTTFEGAGDNEPINPDLHYLIPELGVRFTPDYRTLTIEGLNNPSPPTIAFWIGNENDMYLEEPVSSVSFYYSSTVPLGLDGLDEAGNILTSATFPANCPSGNFDIWQPCGVTVGENTIAKLRITGSPGRVAIDDLMVCRFVNQPSGWDKGNKSGWDASTPPGLDKKDKTPSGFEEGNKSGWE